MSLTVKMEGADELVAALSQISKRALQKSTVRRALTKAAEPMRGLASAIAPYDAADPAPHLRDVILISSGTASRAKNPFAMPGDVTVYVGPARTGGHPHAMEMEFGSFKDQAQPYMRPAWEATKDRAFADLGFFMWSEIDGTATRLAVRAARLGG